MHSFTSLTASLAQGNGSSISSILILVLGLLVAMVILAIVAPGLRIPYPVVLVLGGLLVGFVPGLPRFTLDPNIVFLLFLPPLLYASAWQTSTSNGWAGAARSVIRPPRVESTRESSTARCASAPAPS